MEDGVLILCVKSESHFDDSDSDSDSDSDHDNDDSDSTEGLRAKSYKVRIQHTPENTDTDPDLLDEMPPDWSFRCSCPSYAYIPTMCKHIGACLIVNFSTFS